MNLHLYASGPPSTARDGTIVFLHGFPFRGSMWEPQMAALPDGWRGLAPDLRGFGATAMKALPGQVPTGRRIGGRIARDNEPVLTMARLADDIADLIELEVGGPAVICGLSMGGYVAFELWRRHPRTIRGLVLADTRAGADDDEGRENRLRTAQTARSAGARPIATAMLPSLLAPRTMEERPELVDLVRTMILETPPQTLIAALAGMATRHDSGSELATLSVPALVVVGRHDTLTPPDGARAMARALPDARLEIIPDAGHLSNLENPDAFNRALTTFLGRLS